MMDFLRMMWRYPTAPHIWLSIQQKNTLRRFWMNYKKIILIPIIILLALLLAWFFAGLVVWINQNREWFASLGPWGSSGGFISSLASIMMIIISFLGGVALATWVAVEGT